MAMVVESTASQTSAVTDTVTITKPTGLTVGDLMVAVLAASGSAAVTINTKSGWTLVANRTCTNSSVNVQYKIADSSDVAASNFAFTASVTTGVIGGSILRCSGQADGNELDTSDTDFNNSASSSTISFTTTLSPASDGNLLVMAFAGNTGSAASGSIGSYTVTGDSLTFTELFDGFIDLAGTEDPIIGAAYAVQDTQADLTAYGATLSSNKTAHAGIIVSFQVQVDANVTAALKSVSPAFHTPTATANVAATTALKALSPTFFAPTSYFNTPPVFSNQAKNAASMTNQTKTAAFSPTNQAKSSCSWTNLDKS